MVKSRLGNHHSHASPLCPEHSEPTLLTLSKSSLQGLQSHTQSNQPLTLQPDPQPHWPPLYSSVTLSKVSLGVLGLLLLETAMWLTPPCPSGLFTELFPSTRPKEHVHLSPPPSPHAVFITLLTVHLTPRGTWSPARPSFPDLFRGIFSRA